MKKFALVLAAALIVSAPLVAGMSTDTYAAAKAKKAAKGGKEVKTDPNGAFGQALGDLFASFGQPWPTDKGGKKGGKKSKKG